VTAVAAHDQIGQDLERAAGSLGAHAEDAAILFDEFRSLGLHLQLKRGERTCVVRQEVQEVPLRHEGDELAVRRHMPEVGDHHALVADRAAQLGDLFMR
jgi:hypothetical protein